MSEKSSGGASVQAALLGRLGAHPVQLPALRERIEDLGRLAAYFLRGAGRVADRVFETEAFHALCLYDWPHNVRELQKVIAEAELLSAGAPAISFEHLPASITALVEPGGEGSSAVDVAPADGAVRDPIDPAVKTARTRRPAPSAAELIELLGRYQGNVAHVARHLKRQYAVVWRCIQRYGIAADDFRPSADAAGGVGGAALPENPLPDGEDQTDEDDDIDAEPEKGS
jgi:DNA-binding NtrC family response regulator